MRLLLTAKADVHARDAVIFHALYANKGFYLSCFIYE